MVRVGKPRRAADTPILFDHYQSLPAATTKPKGPKLLDSIPTHMKPADYIGLYIIVIASSVATVNILYRIYY